MSFQEELEAEDTPAVDHLYRTLGSDVRSHRQLRHETGKCPILGSSLGHSLHAHTNTEKDHLCSFCVLKCTKNCHQNSEIWG